MLFWMLMAYAGSFDNHFLMFQCEPDKKSSLSTFGNCTYNNIVIISANGKQHKYRIKDVIEASIKEMNRLGIKEVDESK